MKLYNQIAGGSLDRLSGLSDGVFGFAMTVYAVRAALCFISVPLSIGCFLTVQLIYAIAPGVRLLYRL